VANRGFKAEEIDSGTPHPARMYDYYLGGHDNYEVDRDAAERIIAVLPVIREGARENRAFLGRAVHTLVADHGVRQIIDIGTGIPTSPNTHEIAQNVAKDTRVVYVDNDPIVGAHAQGRLMGVGYTAFVPGDVRAVESILEHPDTRELIDFTQPVAVLMVALLHFLTDAQDPGDVVARLREHLPAGSYIVISHATRDRAAPAMSDSLAELTEVYKHATAPLTLRTFEQVHSLFEGFELLEPGLVSVADWYTDYAEREPHWMGIYAGVGRKP
jgi:S-adenosyl methyltransferase